MTEPPPGAVPAGRGGYGALAWYREVAAALDEGTPSAASRTATAYYRRGRQVRVRPDPEVTR